MRKIPNTFGIDVTAARFLEYGSEDELRELIAAGQVVAPWLHIGGGSNLLFIKDYEGTVLHSRIGGLEVTSEDEEHVWVRVGAGVVWDDFVAWCEMVKKVVPKSITSRLLLVGENLKYAMGGYFKAQFKIMGVVFAILLVGFTLMQIRFSILLAIAIAFLDFLPFFGTGTALIPWAIYKFLVGDYKMVAALVILYGVTQLVRQLIQPKLVGDSMGLNPLYTLFLLYLGYRVGSVLGMIFAVPIGLILLNLYQAGAFDYILNDVKILAEGILSLRE